jgi:hypothetical protein
VIPLDFSAPFFFSRFVLNFSFCLFSKVGHGAPLVIVNKKEKRAYQIGVIAGPIVSANTMTFVRVSHYVKWIQETVANN